MVRATSRLVQLAAWVCMMVLAAVACSDEPHLSAGADSEELQLLLTDPVLVGTDQTGVLYPEGFRIRSIDIAEPLNQDARDGALSQVVWELNGQANATTAVFFVVFSSSSAARNAWDNGRLRLNRPFRVRADEALEDWGYPAVLAVGWVQEGAGPRNGFSSATGLIGNVIVRTVSISELTPYTGNSHDAADLLRFVAGHLAGEFPSLVNRE
jgi:hypothetical protein